MRQSWRRWSSVAPPTAGPLIAISSPYARKGELWTTFKRDYGAQGNLRILVAHAGSRDMNPTLRQADIDREMARDPAAGLAEYYAEFRTDISAFVSQEVIDGCVAHGVFELPPAAGVSYLGFVDPSGGASDAMTLAIAHRLGDMVILDAVREIQPPFNPDAATAEFSTLLKAYRVATVIGDRYAGEWVREPFRRHGIDYHLSEVSKSDIYRDALPLFNAGRAQLLDLKLLAAWSGTARGGRDLIDHPQHPGAHDDLANAVCGAFVMLERDRRPQLISVADVVGVDGLPPPLPRSPGALIRHIEPDGLKGRRNPTLVRSGRNPALRRRGAALSFKADDPVAAALQGAFLAAISLKFDQQLSSKPKPRLNAQPSLAAEFFANLLRAYRMRDAKSLCANLSRRRFRPLNDEEAGARRTKSRRASLSVTCSIQSTGRRKSLNPGPS
jgi:hypothetical protein